HSRLQRIGEFLKLRASDYGFASVALLRGIGAKTFQRDYRIIGSDLHFGRLLGCGGSRGCSLGSGGGWCSWLRSLPIGQACEQETHKVLGTHESISSSAEIAANVIVACPATDRATGSRGWRRANPKR